jgi:ATP-dependent DNA helicase RecQ
VTSPRVRSQKIGTETFEEEQLDPDVLARFERLRNARLELARDRQLPPYCICHDRTLKLIARHAPRDAETLEQIKGMGPHKVRMYGEKFLGAIQDT